MEEENKRQRELVSKLIEAANHIEKQARKGKADSIVIPYDKLEEMKEYIKILERMKKRGSGIDKITKGNGKKE